MQCSRSKINSCVTVNCSYQNIRDLRCFDVANINDYDILLGMPWIYQHKVCIGLNPARIVIGSDEPLPIVSGTDTKYLLGAASISPDEDITKARDELMAYMLSHYVVMSKRQNCLCSGRSITLFL